MVGYEGYEAYKEDQDDMRQDFAAQQEDLLEELSDIGSNFDVFAHLKEVAELFPNFDKACVGAEGVDELEEATVEGDPDIHLKMWMHNGGVEFSAVTERKPVQGILYFIYDLFSGVAPAEVANAEVFFVDEVAVIGIAPQRIEAAKRAVALVQDYARRHA